MQEYRDPLSNLFCVTFDNSSVKSKFYSNIQSLNETLKQSIFKDYIDPQFKNNYYNNLGNGSYTADKLFYETGDIIRMGYFPNDTSIYKDKFFFFNTGAFGECERTQILKFMVDIPKVSCGKQLVNLYFSVTFYYNF